MQGYEAVTTFLPIIVPWSELRATAEDQVPPRLGDRDEPCWEPLYNAPVLHWRRIVAYKTTKETGALFPLSKTTSQGLKPGRLKEGCLK